MGNTICDLLCRKVANGYCARISSSVRHWREKRQFLRRESAHTAGCSKLWVILARLDAAEDERYGVNWIANFIRRLQKIADNPMVYSVLAAADQLRKYCFRDEITL